MSLSTSHRQPLADEVTAKLRQMIHSGEWQLQQRIPSETELMAGLGVSRGTLREAIKALAHSGMLEVRRGDGTYVRAISEISGAARRMYQDHTEEHSSKSGWAWTPRPLASPRKMQLATTSPRCAWCSPPGRSPDMPLTSRVGPGGLGFHARVAQASGNPLLHELYVNSVTSSPGPAQAAAQGPP